MLFIVISVIVISIIGTLSHFLYDVSKHNKVVGLFAAVNESTWEHIKIALTPTFLWSIIDGIIYGGAQNYFLAKYVSLITIVFLIPLLFYGYKLVFKKENTIFNISTFYISITASQLLFKYILSLPQVSNTTRYLSCIGVFILFGCYMVLTLMPAKNAFFKDPITKKYGFKGHTDVDKEH